MKEKSYMIIFSLLIATAICNVDENMLRLRRLDVQDDQGCNDASLSLAISCGKLTAVSIMTDGVGAVILSELRRECLQEILKWPFDCRNQIKAVVREAVQAYCKAFPYRCDESKDPCSPNGGILHGEGQSAPCNGCMRKQGNNICWYCEDSKSYTENCQCPQHCEWGCNKVTGECESCKRHWWGPTCSNKCGEHCEWGCDKVTGKCGSCDRGWWGTTCSNECGKHCVFGCNKETGACADCERGWWGTTCSNKCGEHCVFGCNKETGKCAYCDRGWWGTITCSNKCGEHCIFGCNKETGECSHCERDWWGTTCSSKCPGNCSFGCNKVIGTC